MKNLLILCLIISQFTIFSCARKRTPGNDELCGQQIKLAEEQTGKTIELDKMHKTTITNLISAAKIHQQHNEQMLCLEKIQRALTLLEQNPQGDKAK